MRDNINIFYQVFQVAIVAFLFPSEFAYFHVLAVLLHKISLEMASDSFALLGRRSRTLLKEWWSHAFTCMGNGSRNAITLRYTKKSLMRTWSWCVNGSWRLWNGHQMIQTRRRLAEEGMRAYFHSSFLTAVMSSVQYQPIWFQRLSFYYVTERSYTWRAWKLCNGQI